MSATYGQNFSRIGRSPDFLWPFEIFGPIGRNGNEKFKGVPKIFGDRYQKSVLGKVASCRRLPYMPSFVTIRPRLGTFRPTFSKRHCAP